MWNKHILCKTLIQWVQNIQIGCKMVSCVNQLFQLWQCMGSWVSLVVGCVLTLVGQACVILLCVSIQATSPYTVPVTLCHNGLWSLQQYPDGSFWRLGSGMDCKWSGCVQTQPSAVLWGGKSASPSPLHLVMTEGETTCPWTVGSFLPGNRSGCALGLLAKRRGYITWHDSLLERRYHLHPAWRLSPPIWCGVHGHTRNWTSDEAKK